MWRRQNVEPGEPIPASLPQEQFPLCGGCSKWLTKTIKGAYRKGGAVNETLVAGPVRVQAQASEHRCAFCRALLPRTVSIIGISDAVDGGEDSIMTSGLCPSCDQWLVNLAVDSRSARSVARRQSEGEYGLVLHPNLRRVRASFLIQSDDLRAAVEEACAQLGLSVTALASETTIDVMFAEAATGGPLEEAIRTAGASAKTVVLVRAEETRELRDAIKAGAADWVTVPFTPQQLVGVLQRVTMQLSQRVTWDLETCVPMVHKLETTRPAIAVTPGDGVDPLLVAWSLRRFARGYDDIVMVDGRLVLLPLARPEYQWAIIERLTVVMGERAILLPYEAPRSKRFEASA